MLFATRDDVLGSERVDFIKFLPWAPNAGDGGCVEDCVHAFARAGDCVAIANVAANRFDAKLTKLGVVAAGEGPDLVATCDELFCYVAAEESAAASDESFHV